MRKEYTEKAVRAWRNALVAGGALLLAGLLGSPAAFALPQFLSQVPAGQPAGCQACHTQPPALNDLGQAFKDNGFSFAGLSPAAPPAAPENAGKAAAAEGSGATAGAKPHLELLLPAGAVRGERVELKARLTAGGQSVKDSEVQFFEETEFFLQGRVKLGSARTDAEGIATLHYWPRAEESQVKLVASATGGGAAPAEAAASLPLTAGSPLVEPVEGLSVPFLGLWTVALLIAVVWAVYAYVVYHALQIPRLGRQVGEEELPEVREEQRYA